MTTFRNVLRSIYWNYRITILRDSNVRVVRDYFRIDGDNTLRLEYPLNEDSVVVDVGGYLGDFAARIYDMYKCRVYIFEPMPKFYEHIVSRFRAHSKIVVLNCGLSSKDACARLTGKNDETSFLREGPAGDFTASMRGVENIFRELGIKRVDLMKVNIEGGEYDLIPALVSSGLIQNIGNLQVQFHRFVSGSEVRRKAIREALIETHAETWCFPFVWENWTLKTRLEVIRGLPAREANS